MPELKPKKFMRIEQLINEGKTEEALERIRSLQSKLWQKFLLIPESVLKEAFQNKEYIKKIGNEIDLAYSYLLIGNSYILLGEKEKSLRNALKSLKLFEKNDYRVGLASSLSLVGRAYMENYNFRQSKKILERCLSVKEITPWNKTLCLNIITNVYGMQGYFTKALEFCDEGLKLAEEIGDLFNLSFFHFYKGLFNFYRGNYEEAYQYLKNGIKFAEKINNMNIKAFALYQLTFICIISNSTKKARDYYSQLEEFEAQTENKFVTYFYFITKGLILKESGRTRDRAETERLFKIIVDDEDFRSYNIQNLILSHYAIYFLCRLYLEELEASNNIKVIDDLKPLILILKDHAEIIQSFLWFAELKVLQALLELIHGNFDRTKNLLLEVQQIAESEGLDLLAIQVSNIHDILLEQEELWEKSEELNTPFSERFRLGEFDVVLNRIQGRDLKKVPVVESEKPVFLLIISGDGDPLFSHFFSSDLSFEDDIVSSFISAFNTFSGELFSKGLDRAKFGDYIILMESVESYSVCYLFKGQSYPAKQKLTKFVVKIQKIPRIWQTFEKFHRTSQVAEIKDVPGIQELLNEIFF